MNRNTGTKLHSVIDALRAIGASESAMGNYGDGWDAAHAKLCGYARAALPGQTLAELTLLADDIEQDGYRNTIKPRCTMNDDIDSIDNTIEICEYRQVTDPANAEFWRRLAGSLRKALELL